MQQHIYAFVVLSLILVHFSTVVNADEPVDCLMVQMDELCIDDSCGDGNSGMMNEGWRCADIDGTDFELIGLPPGFLQNNKANLFSGVTILKINLAKKNRGNSPGERNEIIINRGAIVSYVARNSSGNGNGGNGNNGIGNNSSSNNNNGNGRGNNKRMLRSHTTDVDPSTTTIDPSSRWSRFLASNEYNQVREGSPGVLVIRVSAADESPTLSASQIADDVFGVHGDPVNLTSQYSDCSGGKLNFIPASGPYITDGVAEITLTQNVIGVPRTTVHGYVDNYIAANHASWVGEWTHILYVLPQGVDFGGAAAYAYSGWYKSVYRNTYSSKLSVLMHEIGHNLRMLHSGKGTAQYADHSGYMGNPGPVVDDGPVMCFNAAKSWHLGWYDDGHEIVDLSSGENDWNLVGINDFNNGHFDRALNERVILKILHSSDPSEDLYIMYNRAKGVNAGVVADADKVVIIKGELASSSIHVIPTVALQSWWVAALDEFDNPSIRLPGYARSKSDNIIIKVCRQEYGSIPDYASVKIYLDDGVNTGECDIPNPTAAPEPSSSPTMLPTLVPSNSPSTKPTQIPSKSPSESPSLSNQPTMFPTKSQSTSPTTSVSPTPGITDSPTEVPTNVPSMSPTATPTVTTSNTPTMVPSMTPSTSPSLSMSPTKTPTCSLAGVDESCINDWDCCSGICSKGKRSDRVCLLPPDLRTCSAIVGDKCTYDSDCCPLQGLQCSTERKLKDRRCYQS